MRCSPELLNEIRQAIESIAYGSVEVSLSEKGSYVEIIIKNKVRIDKETPDKE
jgi:hypothetical protein